MVYFTQNQKVIGVINWSKATEVSSVSREVPMTKELLTLLTETQGIRIHSSMYHFNYVMPKVMVIFSTLFSLSGF